MNITFTPNAWDDYHYWLNNDKKILKKINSLIKDIQRDPDNEGIGKAEKLKYELSGFYSRRIDRANRIVYKIENNCMVIFQLRYHY